MLIIFSSITKNNLSNNKNRILNAHALHEKRPNKELFLVRVFSPNTGKYGPEITLYLTHLTHHKIT